MARNLIALAVAIECCAGVRAGAEKPKLVHRNEQPYIGIRTTVTLQGMAAVMPKHVPELYKWMDEHKIKPAGPEFIRYIKVDMEKELVIDVGLPVSKKLSGDGHIIPGVLPAGRYASLTHFGNYSGLVAPNAQVQEWGKRNGLTWRMHKTKSGEEWVGRIEFYKTDPRKEPDPNKWETEILYLTDSAKK